MRLYLSELADMLNTSRGTMAKVEENAKEQKKEDFFCKLVIVLFDTYKIVIHHVLKCN